MAQKTQPALPPQPLTNDAVVEIVAAALKNKDEEIESLNDQIAGWEESNMRLERANNRLEETIEELKMELSDREDDIETMSEEMSNQEDRITELQENVQELELAVAEAYLTGEKEE